MLFKLISQISNITHVVDYEEFGLEEVNTQARVKTYVYAINI